MMRLNGIILAASVATAPLLGACSDTTSTDTSAGTEQATAPSPEADKDEPVSGALPDWFPEGIYLPDDFKLESEQKVGMRTFLLGGTSKEGFEALAGTYPSSLEEAGYTYKQQTRFDDSRHIIHFSGQGIESGQVWLKDLGETRKIRIDFSREIN